MKGAFSKRWPEVGDLLFQRLKSNNKEYSGLVYKVEADGSVFIKWLTYVPYGYYEWYGYAAINIHNDIHTFNLVKACK
tara:strand:+ start:8748 stop:8981 length:234 start_codon:yes stop_codon:yes gene_type:complete